MRVSRTPIALAALLFATACTAGSPDVLAPEAAPATTASSGSTTPVEPGDSVMTGNDAPADERGPGQIGSGN